MKPRLFSWLCIFLIPAAIPWKAHMCSHSFSVVNSLDHAEFMNGPRKASKKLKIWRNWSSHALQWLLRQILTRTRVASLTNRLIFIFTVEIHCDTCFCLLIFGSWMSFPIRISNPIVFMHELSDVGTPSDVLWIQVAMKTDVCIIECCTGVHQISTKNEHVTGIKHDSHAMISHTVSRLLKAIKSTPINIKSSVIKQSDQTS